MNNNDMANSVDEIIDLTDVVSVGSAGENIGSSHAEDDVLDSLVNDFEKKLDTVSLSESGEENEESDEPLDLARLDNLINSYKLDFDADENNQGDDNQHTVIDTKNDMDVAFVPDERLHAMQANSDENSIAEQNNFDAGSQNTDIDAPDIPSFDDIDLPSLEEEQDDIDQLTKDIIDGTNNTDNTEINLENTIQENASAGDTSFSALLNEEVEQQAKPQQVKAAAPQTADSKTEKQQVSVKSQNTAQKVSVSDIPASEKPQASMEKPLKSNIADDAEEVNEDVFNNIFNELSLEHETDEEVVPFAQEASSDTMPIHLKGDVSFIEAQGKDKTNEDIHLVQSASKVLASGDAYLEKFNGEDDSVGARIKNLSTKIVSLEQRLIGSDSKAQDNALELTYRINGLETKITELQEVVNAELITIKTESAKIDSLAEENNNEENAHEFALLNDKVQALETRVITLDDIFSEQKMLNDELSKNLDNLIQNAETSDNSSQVKALEEKIAVLEGELGAAQAKISALEENIEKAASLAAAKVLREEIIPLLGQ